ncbi:acyl-coenzyme A thioesterase 13-like [Heterocephalus glaber]|uniref:Acyl-coenzyme A thioesterase 13 n=1 Tax=Heterocephalus glaber TaxID=10181 RepID=A0AAX6R566_HETGA|nr:acyl-coenzyme A thioesterase 13-like [Heterocephalus glaber]
MTRRRLGHFPLNYVAGGTAAAGRLQTRSQGHRPDTAVPQLISWLFRLTWCKEKSASVLLNCNVLGHLHIQRFSAGLRRMSPRSIRFSLLLGTFRSASICETCGPTFFQADSRFTVSSMSQSLWEAMKFMTRAPGFDRVWEKVTLVSAAPEKVICEMKVEEEHTNKQGTLHGGFTATLTDSISRMALLFTERGVPGVSVDMNITGRYQPSIRYMSPAKIGEEIVITANILKQGKTLAFASVDMTNKATGKLIAQGRHTKHLGN